jgi:hypothetical protein
LEMIELNAEAKEDFTTCFLCLGFIMVLLLMGILSLSSDPLSSAKQIRSHCTLIFELYIIEKRTFISLGSLSK